MLKTTDDDIRPADEVSLKLRDDGGNPAASQTLMIHVDGERLSTPFHCRSYLTIKKLGIAMTTIGAAFLCLCGLTMQDIWKEIYVFYIPGLSVTIAGSFAISAAKVKRRRVKRGLVVATVVLAVCAMAGALYSIVTGSRALMEHSVEGSNILLIVRVGVAVVVLIIAGFVFGMTVDSLLCGRHRPGYSNMVKLVCNADDIDIDQLDGLKSERNGHSHHKGHHHHGSHSPHLHGNHSPRLNGSHSPHLHGSHSPHHHGSHSPRHHGKHSPHLHGNHSPHHHGDRSPRSPRHHGNHSPRPHSPRHHGEQSNGAFLQPDQSGNHSDRDGHHHHRDGHHHKHHRHHHHHHHPDEQHRHQQDDHKPRERKQSGLERMASMDHSYDQSSNKKTSVSESPAWDALNRM